MSSGNKKIEQKIKTRLKDVIKWRVKKAEKLYAISKDKDKDADERKKAYLESQKLYESAKEYVMDCLRLIKENDIKNEELIEKIKYYKDKLKILADDADF